MDETSTNRDRALASRIFVLVKGQIFDFGCYLNAGCVHYKHAMEDCMYKAKLCLYGH